MISETIKKNNIKKDGSKNPLSTDLVLLPSLYLIIYITVLYPRFRRIMTITPIKPITNGMPMQ